MKTSLKRIYAKDGIFNFYDPDDRLDAFSVIRQPILAVMGRKDDALTVPIEEMMERIKKAATQSSRTETVILGDANHGYIGSEQGLADVIREWIVSIK